jgi:selenocysteine-specific elongation factor
MLIATAGHVDHGKTLLVRALTGVDTDRLPEEKARGLTIDLGFAYLSLDDGRMLGFVDVPGHERFIRNMIAGVPAIDFALLVVAADDGPMPQTAEHLAILDLLGIARGAVVVSKADRVDAPRLAEVCGQARVLVARSRLAGAPVFALSALTGEGLDPLRNHLLDVHDALPARGVQGGFRFAVDRSFSVHGAGLVVTGAVYAGEVAVGDRVLLAGGDLEARVRGIETAGTAADVARAGMRCALNVAGRGVDSRSVTRGVWLVAADAGPLSARLDVALTVLASEGRALRQWTPVHVHHGAAFVTGRVTLPAGVPVAPGDTAVAQLVLDRPVAAVHGDRIVLRDTSGQRTLGGATVIDPYAPRRVRDRRARLALLQGLQENDPAEALGAALQHTAEGLDPERFAQSRNLPPGALDDIAAACESVRVSTPAGERLVAPTAWDGMRAAVTQALATAHRDQPSAVGPRELELVRALARGDGAALAHGAVAALVRDGTVVRDGISVRLAEHRPTLSAEDEALWRRVSGHLGPDTHKPLTSGDLAAVLAVERDDLMRFLETCARRGLLVRVAANRFFHPRAIAHLARAAERLSEEHPENGFDARCYRDATGIGRNLTIDVLEFFDALGLTRRAGETRRALRPSAEVLGGGEG